MNENLIDKIWKSNRPPKPSSTIRLHPIEYAGKTVNEKLMEIRANFETNKVHALLSGSLDEIAWLYNIRGKDVACNPVTIAYSVVTAGG